MRGLGKNQAEIRDKMFWKIFGCISDINFHHHRFVTMNDIHRETKININSIRKHIAEGKKSVIREYKGYNNARYFCTSEAEIAIEKNKVFFAKFLWNTQDYINSLKFSKEKKTIPIREKLTGRDYGSLTERQEKRKNKKKVWK